MSVWKATVAAGVSTLVLGCATAHPIAPLDTSSVSYRDPAFRDEDLKASGLALLPVTADHPMDRSVAERVGPRIAVAIENRQVCTVVVHPADVKARFARDGVSDRFSKMVTELATRKELDRPALDAMVQSTGCRYFLQTSVRQGMSYGRGSRAVTTDVYAQLWDASTGDVVWEGIGGGAALTNPPHGGTTEQALAIAIGGVSALLGKDPAKLPPPHVVADLHNEDIAQLQYVNSENAARADAAITGLQVFAAFADIAAALAN